MRFKQLHKCFALTAPLLSYLPALIILGFMLVYIALWSIWHLMSAFSKICASYSQYFWYDIWPLFRFQSRIFFQCCFSWAAVVQDGPFHREKEKSYGSVARSFQLGCGLCRKAHKNGFFMLNWLGRRSRYIFLKWSSVLTPSPEPSTWMHTKPPASWFAMLHK